MPKNRYITEREAFDCEREIFHRRRFRTLMKSILRNQNRKFKLLVVIGYYKLITNTLIRTFIMGSRKFSNLHQRGDSENIRRSMLYHLAKPEEEFPFNIAKRGKEQSVYERTPWLPDEGDPQLSPDQLKEAEAQKKDTVQHSQREKLQRAYQRLEAIGRLRKSSKKKSESAEKKVTREDALKRNLLVAEILPTRRIDGVESPKKKSNVEVPTKKDAIKNLYVILNNSNERKVHRALLRWSLFCKAKQESEYLEEIENVNIVLSERTFRERVFRTKIKLLQETIETQIKQFEDMVKTSHPVN